MAKKDQGVLHKRIQCIFCHRRKKSDRKPYVREGHIGHYMYCKAVAMVQLYYFRVVTNYINPDGSIFPVEIYVPHHYI